MKRFALSVPNLGPSHWKTNLSISDYVLRDIGRPTLKFKSIDWVCCKTRLGDVFSIGDEPGSYFPAGSGGSARCPLSYLCTCRRLRHRFKQQVLYGFIRSFHLLQWTFGSKLFWQWQHLKLDLTEWQASFWFIHLSKSYFIGPKARWSWSRDYPGKEMKWQLTLKYVTDHNVMTKRNSKSSLLIRMLYWEMWCKFLSEFI